MHSHSLYFTFGKCYADLIFLPTLKQFFFNFRTPFATTVIITSVLTACTKRLILCISYDPPSVMPLAESVK